MSGVAISATPYPVARRAGELIFTAGLFDLGAGAHRSRVETPMRSQSKALYESLEQVLGEEGAGLERALGFVQYFRPFDQISDYIDERRLRLAGVQSTSTGIIASGFPLDAAVVQLECIAAADPAAEIRDLIKPDDPVFQHLEQYGFAHALGYRGWVFCSGLMAMDGTSTAPFEGGVGSGVAKAARIDANFWVEDQLGAELEFILGEKIDPLLERAGSGRSRIAYADVHLRYPERDLPSFLRVWDAAFPAGPPATSITPATGLGARNGLIEVTLLALGEEDEREIEALRPDGCGQWLGSLPTAARVGDHVFTGTLDAAGRSGGFEPDFALPGAAFEDPVEQEAATVVARLGKVCAAAGGDLSSLSRVRFSLTDLASLPTVLRVCREHGIEAALSIVEHADGAWTPGCSITASAVAYVGTE